MAQFLSTGRLVLAAPYSVARFQMPAGLPGLATSPAAAAPVTASPGPIGLAQSGAALPATVNGCTGGTGVDGPGNYDDIVAAKQELAEQLSIDVLPILHGAGATGN